VTLLGDLDAFLQKHRHCGDLDSAVEGNSRLDEVLVGRGSGARRDVQLDSPPAIFNRRKGDASLLGKRAANESVVTYKRLETRYEDDAPLVSRRCLVVLAMRNQDVR
jgi:hypothetical protein